MDLEQVLVDCCSRFLEFIEDLKCTEKITQEEYDDMAKLKIEFLSSHAL
jgi:hypothetical protein